MNSRLKWIAAALLAAVGLVGASGCVAQREADQMRTLYRRSQEQLVDLRTQLEEANARINALRHAGPSQDTQAQLSKLTAQRNRLQKALQGAQGQLRQVSQQQVVLPPSLDTALRQLAQQHPNLMTYKPNLGMVKFQSDLTFALGSAQVNGQARQTLARLAQVLRSPAARGYEVRIVGYTDNVPIRNPATKAKHPTNWYLSVDRAIGVKNVLQQAGVPPQRMGVAGYGQYRPVAPNGPHGAQANRRVEIYLVQRSGSEAGPMQAGSSGGAGGQSGQGGQGAAAGAGTGAGAGAGTGRDNRSGASGAGVGAGAGAGSSGMGGTEGTGGAGGASSAQGGGQGPGGRRPGGQGQAEQTSPPGGGSGQGGAGGAAGAGRFK